MWWSRQSYAGIGIPWALTSRSCPCTQESWSPAMEKPTGRWCSQRWRRRWHLSYRMGRIHVHLGSQILRGHEYNESRVSQIAPITPWANWNTGSLSRHFWVSVSLSVTGNKEACNLRGWLWGSKKHWTLNPDTLPGTWLVLRNVNTLPFPIFPLLRMANLSKELVKICGKSTPMNWIYPSVRSSPLQGITNTSLCEWNDLFLCLQMTGLRTSGMWKLSVLCLHLPCPHHQYKEGPWGHREKDWVATVCAGHGVRGLYIHYLAYLIFTKLKGQIPCPGGACIPLAIQNTQWKAVTDMWPQHSAGRREWLLLTRQAKEAFDWLLKEGEIGKNQEKGFWKEKGN